MQMNKVYVVCIVSLLFSIQTAFPWTLYVTNWVNKVVTIHTSWAGSAWAFGKCFSCCDDHVMLQPGQRVGINAGECLLTEIRVDGGTSYKSSGQRIYNEFYVVGPVQNEIRVGRIDLVLRPPEGTIKGLVHNATPFPATDVKVMTLKCPRPKGWNWDPQENNPANKTIRAGEVYTFDMTKAFIKSIHVTLNGKTISWDEQYNRCGDPRPTEFYISGPPDGSDPKIIGLVQ